jgi:transcriptional regulator with XRE-family HTH domain
MSHWTQGGVSDFVYNISLDFFTQLEDRIHESELQKKEIAERLSISASAVSQMLNNPPEKPELETLVKYARAVGAKVSVVLYNDDDPTNERGPVYSGIFEKSWQALDKPRDLEAIKEATSLVGCSMLGFSVSTPAKFFGGGIYSSGDSLATEFVSHENIGSTIYSEAKQYQQPFGYLPTRGNTGIRQNSTASTIGNILTQTTPQEERKAA